MITARLRAVVVLVSVTFVAFGNYAFAQTKTKHVDPVYPADAIAAGVQGDVTLQITIGTDGHTYVTRVVRSIPLLDQAAVVAVRQWEYDPRSLRTATRLTVTIPFKLPAAGQAQPAVPSPTAASSSLPSQPQKPSDLLKQQKEKEARERPPEPRGARGPVCGPASTAPPRLLAASDSVGLKAASCMPVTVTGTVTRVDRRPLYPHAASLMTRLYFAPDIFVQIQQELDAAVQARLGIKETGVWRLRNQKITVHMNPLFIEPKGGPIQLLLRRAEDISLSSGQLTPAPTALVSDDFMAEGVANSTLVTNLFTGNFTAIDLDPNSSKFLMIMNAYLFQYGQYCAPYLPAKKVEIMGVECATERVTRNGFGTEMSRVCVKWAPTEHTGLFADPALYDARDSIQLSLGFSVRSDEFSLLDFKDVIYEDMIRLIHLNGCNSPTLKRFQENLRLFALNRQPIRLEH
jgi:TonB family protein